MYLFLKKRLYFARNSSLPPRYWEEVASSTISPSNATINPTPLCSFKGQVYGWYWARDHIEQIEGSNICRSSDVGKTEMKWDLVAEFSFGHHEKISTPAFMLAGIIAWQPWLRNDRIWIGTNTRTTGSFGAVATYKSDGVEVWESSTGDRGSWSRINHPGFGTETIVSGNTIRTNQEIHSATIAFDGNGEFLLVGTATHFPPGGQIWRYDGTGVTGWQNMTPWWTYSNPVSPFTKRFQGLVSWDRLYAAEGSPSGNLGSYDYITNKWTMIVEGPRPFGPEEGGISSLVAGPGDNLYALTTPALEVPFEQKNPDLGR